MAKVSLGVGVGTGSARAVIFDNKGQLLAAARHDIQIWYEAGEIVEQSARDIWAAVSASIRSAVRSADLNRSAIGAIGVAAACSLAAVDPAGEPLPVDPSENPERNVIVWMDHRAIEQARPINVLKHPVLAYVEGRTSPAAELQSSSVKGEQAEDLRCGWTLLRPSRLSYVATDGKPRPVGVYGYMQMDLPGASATLRSDILPYHAQYPDDRRRDEKRHFELKEEMTLTVRMIVRQRFDWRLWLLQPIGGTVCILAFAYADAAIAAIGTEWPAQKEFDLSCSGCHGVDGRGPDSTELPLSVQPLHLTTLRVRNGNVFPRERLRRIIDG